MKKVDSYPPLGSEYDDEETPRLGVGLVYGIIGLLTVIAIIVGGIAFKTAGVAYGLVLFYL